MSATNQLKRAFKDASEYVAMVGKEQPHLQSIGNIHTLTVDTQIHYQHAPSTQNYWKDPVFDKALSYVIKKRFGELAKEALGLLENEYKQSLIAEKGELLAKLAQIEALEKEKTA